MAKYPSVLKDAEFGVAKRISKCSFNKSHLIKKDDKYLLIKSSSIKLPFPLAKKYCISCANHILEASDKMLKELMREKLS